MSPLRFVMTQPYPQTLKHPLQSNSLTQDIILDHPIILLFISFHTVHPGEKHFLSVAGRMRGDDLPTQAPCLKDMRGQKMLWTCWEPCWMGKLLFSCSVPSLSTTLSTPGEHKPLIRFNSTPHAMENHITLIVIVIVTYYCSRFLFYAPLY